MQALPRNGVTANHDLKGLAIGQVQLFYTGRHVPLDMKGVEIECEIYKIGDALMVHTVCPRCRRAQSIDGRNKKVEYDQKAGTLRIEPFECTWEIGDERQQFGVGLCRTKLAYEGKIVRDA